MKTLILLAALTGCVTGPKTEKKSALNVLNGENYQVNSSAGVESVQLPLPLNLERRERLTRIEGRVQSGTDAFAALAPRIEVALLGPDGRELERTMTDTDGQFKFARGLPNGRYRVRSESKSFRGETRFDVAAYEVTGLILVVH